MYDLIDKISAVLPLALLVFARMSAMITTMPIFGYGQVSVKVRMMLSVVLSFIIIPLVADVYHLEYTSFLALFFDVIREVFIGMIIGFGARLVFEGFAMAGSYIGFQMGMAIMTVFDPSSEQQQPFISNFWLLVMVVFFLVTDSHYFLVDVLFQNYASIHLGSATFRPLIGRTFIEGGQLIYYLALQFAAPTIIVILLLDVSVAFMARVMPQLNIFFISLPLKIGLGIFMLIVSLRIFQTLFAYIFGQLESFVLTLMTGFGG